jgi:protein-S-isoprenylcysteine O-methyltransferase Ste14
MLLSALILFGLLAALLGTGLWYELSWAAMCVPLFIICAKVLQQRRRTKREYH